MAVGEIIGLIVESLTAPLGLHLLITGLVYAVLVLSLNIEYGWAGIPNFGKIAFIAMGAIATHIVYYLYVFPKAAAYYAEVAPDKFTLVGLEPGDYPKWPGDAGSYTAINFMLQIALPYLQEHLLVLFEFMLLSAALGGLLGAIIGLILAYPVVRLREDYLAILLLMFSFMLWNFLTAIPPLIGGSQGFRVTYDPFKVLGLGNVDYGRLVAIILIFGVMYLLVDRLTHSPYGRTLRAMRDDELAAATMGKNISRIRLETIVMGSFLAAVGGVAFVFILFPSVTPDLFKPEVTFMLIAMMLLGGAGNNVGAVLGVFAFLYIFRVTTALTAALPGYLGVELAIPEGLIRNVLTGILIILVLFYRPRGIIPEESVKTVAWDIFNKRLGFIPPSARGTIVLLAGRLRNLIKRRKG